MSDAFGLGQAASGIASAAASIESAHIAADAAKQAAALQQQRYDTTRGDLSPFTTTGQGALPNMLALAKSGPNGGGTDYLSQAAGMQPGQMTQAQLEQTPGYQFQLNQGLQATQNSAAARGLGVSGAALKGAASYATGLANSNYQTQFQNAQTRFQNVLNLNTGQQGNLTNQFNRLNTTATLGENAAAQTGTTGAALANQAGQGLIAAGGVSAAGVSGAANALTGAAQNYLSNNALQQATAYQTATNPVNGQQYSVAANANDVFI